MWDIICLVYILHWLEISLLLILEMLMLPSKVHKFIRYLLSDYLAILLDGPALFTKKDNYVFLIMQALKIILYTNYW